MNLKNPTNCALLHMSKNLMQCPMEVTLSITQKTRSNQGMNVKVFPLSQSNPRISLLVRKHLINFSKVCITCGQAILDQSKFIKGGMVSVKSTCINSHINTWDSQPYVNGMPLCSLLIPAAILFTGNTFTPTEHFSSCLNFQMISKTTT